MRVFCLLSSHILQLQTILQLKIVDDVKPKTEDETKKYEVSRLYVTFRLKESQHAIESNSRQNDHKWFSVSGCGDRQRDGSVMSAAVYPITFSMFLNDPVLKWSYMWKV